MINNWDIISRIDPTDKSRRFTLVTDGTEHDARLIAKKLEGYAQPPAPAAAPFVYAFELPADLDEDTLEKIRTAVREGVEQTNKINQFVPGGVLGDPLFNADVAKDDKAFPTFITLDPSESFFQAQKDNAACAPEPPEKPEPLISDEVPVNTDQQQIDDFQAHRVHIDTTDRDALGIEKQTVSAPSHTKEQSGEITISDKDMLIKDMEGTLLDKMPLEDIFSAETKYDMFLDLENQKLVKNSQTQREQKMSSLADGRDSLEESFNIFEQKIKDQTCIIDLDDLNAITDRLPKKDMEFIKHAATGNHAADQTQPPSSAEPVNPAAEPKPAAAGSAPDSASTEPAPEFAGTNEPPRPPQAAPDETPHPVSQAEDPFEEIEKKMLSNQIPQAAKSAATNDSASLPDSPAENASGKPEPFSAGNKVDASSITEPPAKTETDEEPLNLGPSPEEASLSSFSTPSSAKGTMPDEVALLNTVPPTAYSHKTISPEGANEDLPEITIRGQKLDSLEKTFNLETTLNTEIMKHQYERSFHDISTPPAVKKPAAAPQPQAPAAAQPPQVPPTRAEKQKRKVLRLVGKKTNVSQNGINHKISTPVQPGEPDMEENQEPKTTFRIRRKTDTPHAPAAPVPPAPAAPAAPTIAAPQHPGTPTPPHIQAKPAAANTIIEKTKTIDHSIEIPLSELKKHNWPLEVPLVPTYTLETMVMSVNRFAHATAISVIENPGKLYNPLVLHGATGTGKTHFLNAMAYAFSKKYGQENIFMTNGVRLSRGIQRYVMEGNIEKFEKFMDTVKVLLIDDIHLLAINEQNRVHISKLLNKFLRDQKQIVITSKYPPESLEKLEELIKFKLDSGWISELKPASGAAHLKIVKKMLLDNGVDLNDTQISQFFGGPHMTLGTVTRSIRRLKVLENLIFPHLPEADRSQAVIFEKLLATGGEDADSEILSRDPETLSSITTTGNGEWGRIGFFYPQNSSHMMNWMVYALQQRAKELGVSGGFEIAVRSSYATENIISSAFKIANLCDNKKLKGAVILGPALTVCDPSVRENFYDILTHMLEIMLIRCGIINFEDAKAPSTYVKVLSELLR